MIDIRTGKQMTRGGFLKGILASGIAPSITLATIANAGSANASVGRGMMRNVGARNAAMFGGGNKLDYTHRNLFADWEVTPSSSGSNWVDSVSGYVLTSPNYKLQDGCFYYKNNYLLEYNFFQDFNISGDYLSVLSSANAKTVETVIGFSKTSYSRNEISNGVFSKRGGTLTYDCIFYVNSYSLAKTFNILTNSTWTQPMNLSCEGYIGRVGSILASKTGRDVKAYIDGVKVREFTSAGDYDITVPNMNYCVKIFAIRAYDDVLTDEEVAANNAYNVATWPLS